MNDITDAKSDQPQLWTLIRDIAVLQVKLIVDGLRDLLLVPASLIAGIVSIVRTDEGKPGNEFLHSGQHRQAE